MQNAVLVGLYCLGIRLTQCRVIHEYYWPAEFPQSLSRSGEEPAIGPDSIKRVLASISKLGKSLEEVAGFSEFRWQLEAGIALLEGFQRNWVAWGEDGFLGWYESSQDDHLAPEFRKLEKIILAVVEYHGSRFAPSRLWFSLGRNIADGAWLFRNDSRALQEVCEPESDEQTSRIWRPRSLKRVNRLIRELEQSRDMLLPNLQKAGKHLSLLPYDFDDFWPWFRLEEGLNRLRGDTENRASTDRHPAPEQGHAANVSATPTTDYLEIRFEDGQITRGEKSCRNPRKQVLAALKFLASKGEIFTSVRCIQKEMKQSSLPAAKKLVNLIRQFLRNSGLGVKLVKDDRDGCRLELDEEPAP